MTLENKLCRVSICSEEEIPAEGSDTAGKYDCIYNPDAYTESDFYNVFSISVSVGERSYSMALIGDGNSCDTNCAVLDGTELTVLQGWDVFRFDLETGRIVKHGSVDSLGTNFAIFALNGGFLVYGEIDITMLDRELEPVWSFSGQDIFVSKSGKTAFEIKEDRICLYDFLDYYYEIDFDGRLIAEVKSRADSKAEGSRPKE